MRLTLVSFTTMCCESGIEWKCSEATAVLNADVHRRGYVGGGGVEVCGSRVLEDLSCEGEVAGEEDAAVIRL